MEPRAYHNEHDAKAAATLRELIARDVIAPGDVDERSIVDVTASDLAGYAQCHFFAGFGVWSYALRRAGWPDSRRVWTGSCPCQPFSQAGAGAGFDDPRHLWPHWYRRIVESRPDVIFGEQVASKSGLLWLDVVSADLENSDYAIGACDTCAAGIGAPHIRQRLYFVAHPGSIERPPRTTYLGRFEGGSAFVEHRGSSLLLADDDENGRPLFGTSRLHDRRKSGDDSSGCGETRELVDAPGGSSGIRIHGRQSEEDIWRESSGSRGERAAASGALRFVADTDAGGLRVYRLAAGDGASLGDIAHAALSGAVSGFWRDADWLYCTDGKARPVEPKSFPLAHGAAERVGRLRGYGNALCAPQAIAFIEAYLEVTNER